MATLFTDIYDLFLAEVTDYKLDALYATSVTDFETYLQGFLKRAIPKFTNCAQDLTDVNFTTGTFNITLTLMEQTILSSLMAIEWLNKEIQNVSQINIHLNDRDFKHHSAAQNLKEKKALKNELREIVSQDMVDYGILNIPWSDWADDDYGF